MSEMTGCYNISSINLRDRALVGDGRDVHRNPDDSKPITTTQMLLLTFQMLGHHKWEKDAVEDKKPSLLYLIKAPLNISRVVHMPYLAVISLGLPTGLKSQAQDYRMR